ncbi:hypothetical protein GCM10010274_60780 [Streptomyces lavendofoliae]|uniref:Uncharacterized protein n=1 Tax=Streptomyces lavendofoliae TaxID=67314 RepID=A0A918I3I1_9ACTN|nr:hypothetical protein GCM10010274_60780 [Streptomyces lavendofoliae]
MVGAPFSTLIRVARTGLRVTADQVLIPPDMDGVPPAVCRPERTRVTGVASPGDSRRFTTIATMIETCRSDAHHREIGTKRIYARKDGRVGDLIVMRI